MEGINCVSNSMTESELVESIGGPIRVQLNFIIRAMGSSWERKSIERGSGPCRLSWDSEYNHLALHISSSSHDRVGSAGSVVARGVYWVPSGEIPGGAQYLPRTHNHFLLSYL